MQAGKYLCSVMQEFRTYEPTLLYAVPICIRHAILMSVFEVVLEKDDQCNGKQYTVYCCFH